MSAARIVVVGGGVIGLLTAMECARAGAQVDLVDQGGIPNPAATSHDPTRVVRALHRGDAGLTQAAVCAQDAWREVEDRLGGHFAHRVGAVIVLPEDDVAASLALLTGAGAAGVALAPAELASRHPQVQLAADRWGVLEPAACVLPADQMLAGLAGWLRAQPGVRLHPDRRAVEVTEPGAVALADGSTLVGDGVVVAAGPWSCELLPGALGGDLTLYRQSMISYATGLDRSAWQGMPAMLGLGPNGDAWLIPPVAQAPVRLSAASASRVVLEVTDRVTPEPWRQHLIEKFRTLVTDFDPSQVLGANDGYYLAHDAGGGPLLARLGAGPVWAYAACGGMSFKFAPLIARALADRALARPVRSSGVDPIDRPRQLTAARSREKTP
ncbi:MAG: FAD-dependent oxidoreductase [Micromonosporaceae bacterium]